MWEFILKIKQIRLNWSPFLTLFVAHIIPKAVKKEVKAAQIFLPYCPSRLLLRINILKNRIFIISKIILISVYHKSLPSSYLDYFQPWVHCTEVNESDLQLGEDLGNWEKKHQHDACFQFLDDTRLSLAIEKSPTVL